VNDQANEQELATRRRELAILETQIETQLATMEADKTSRLIGTLIFAGLCTAAGFLVGALFGGL